MLLVDLPPEIIVQIFLLLSPHDLLACRLANSQLNLVVRESVLVQYTALLQERNLEDNACVLAPVGSKLEELKRADRAWSSARPGSAVNVPVLHQQSGVYDLTGGVYLLSDTRRSAMHYLRLPRTVGDLAEWKVIKSSASIIDIGLCLYEHDMIVNVTTSPFRESIHAPLKYCIHMDILQFSTGKPHPQARNPHILVMNTQWERPGVGIEIVGEHLVLILSYYNTAGSPDDNIFVYEWKTGLVKMHFTASYRTYSGIIFLTEDIIMLPNARTIAFDFYRLPTKATVEAPKPILILSLPLLAPGYHLGGISCRAEPNPIGKASKFGQTAPVADDCNTGTSYLNPSGDTNPADHIENSSPKCPFMPNSIDAICIFDMRIFLFQMVIGQAVGMHMQVQDNHRLTFVAHRRGFLDLVEKWGDGKWDEEEKQRVKKSIEERRRVKEEWRKELLSIKEWKEKVKQERLEAARKWAKANAVDAQVDGESSSTPTINADDDNDQPPPLLPITDSDSSSLDIDDELDVDTDQEDDKFSVRPDVPYTEWGPEITRWFNSDKVGTHWITTTAGERCVRMAENPRGSNAYPYTILDFNQTNVQRAREMLEAKEARMTKEKEKAEEEMKVIDKGKGKEKEKGKGTCEAKKVASTFAIGHHGNHGRTIKIFSAGGASGTSSTTAHNGYTGSTVNGPGVLTEDAVSEQGSTTSATVGSSTVPSLSSPPTPSPFDDGGTYDDMPGLEWHSPSTPPAEDNFEPNELGGDVPLDQAQILQAIFGHGGSDGDGMDVDDDEWEDANDDMDEDQDFFSDDDDGDHDSVASDDVIAVAPGVPLHTMLFGGDFDGNAPAIPETEEGRRRRLEKEMIDEAYTTTPPNRIRVEDQMRQVQPWNAFIGPVEGGLAYVAITSEKKYPFSGILLDEERVIGVRTRIEGGIQGVVVHHFG